MYGKCWWPAGFQISRYLQAIDASRVLTYDFHTLCGTARPARQACGTCGQCWARGSPAEGGCGGGRGGRPGSPGWICRPGADPLSCAAPGVCLRATGRNSQCTRIPYCCSPDQRVNRHGGQCDGNAGADERLGIGTALKNKLIRKTKHTTQVTVPVARAVLPVFAAAARPVAVLFATGDAACWRMPLPTAVRLHSRTNA